MVLLAALAGAACDDGGPVAEPPTPNAGCTWRTVATPAHRYAEGRFDGVAALSSTQAWAVGSTYTGHESGPTAPLVTRWDGSHWVTVTAGLPPDATVLDVDAAAGAVWAVGFRGNDAFVARLNGSRWHPMRPPVPRGFSHLNGVDIVTADDVWAVGARSVEGGGRSLAVHWDGKRWRVVPTPARTRRRSPDRPTPT
jgi:hypothetical protein